MFINDGHIIQDDRIHGTGVDTYTTSIALLSINMSDCLAFLNLIDPVFDILELFLENASFLFEGGCVISPRDGRLRCHTGNACLTAAHAHAATAAHAHAATATHAHAATTTHAHATTTTCGHSTTSACGHPTTSAHAKVTRYIGLVRRSKGTGLELFDCLAGNSTHADNNLNTRCRENLEGIRATISRENILDTVVRHKLCGLNAGASSRCDIRILHGLNVHCLWIYKQIIRSPSKTCLNLIIQGRPRRCYCYFHF